MARKKKSGFGKFIGSLGGNPYDRLMGQFERTVKQNEDDDNDLADELDRFFESLDVDSMKVKLMMKSMTF